TSAAAAFGFGTDLIAPADYDGDGRTDIAVFRGSNNPSEADFYFLPSGDPGNLRGVPFGAVADLPVVADYDGDGKADFAVFRPAENAWYLLRSTAGFTGVVFGLAGDKPVPAAFIR
ncbi:MAG TPA: VCBS repeat-containing protein, partial [Pyrinomonadaceae bacterium]|nr:VCBS repeat-containing protein [Pyrinomonadaceae bacterium]